MGWMFMSSYVCAVLNYKLDTLFATNLHLKILIATLLHLRMFSMAKLGATFSIQIISHATEIINPRNTMKFLSKASFLLIVAAMVFAGCKKSDSDDHLDIGGFRILMNNEVVAQQAGTAVTGQITLNRGQTTSPMTVEFRDPEGRVLNITDNDLYLRVASSATNVVSTRLTSGSKWSFELTGVASGSANITISLMHGNHADFESRAVPVIVLTTDPS